MAFTKYLTGGGSIPLSPEAQAGPSAVHTLRYAICQIAGKDAMDNCPLLRKYTQILRQLLRNFSRLVGHDEHTWRSYELILDRMPAYRVQDVMRPLDQNARMAWTRFQGCGRGRDGGGPGKSHGQLICYNCGGPGCYARDSTNPTCPSCKYFMLFDHETEDCHTLIARIHDKGVLPPPLA